MLPLVEKVFREEREELEACSLAAAPQGFSLVLQGGVGQWSANCGSGD